MGRPMSARTLFWWTGVAAAVAASWYAMMALHELGHVMHAWASGGRVERVVIPFAGFSRTDVAPNPRPLFVAVGGSVWGSLIPCVFWAWAWRARYWWRRWMAAFAGFCLIANGAYIGAGVMMPVGDAADLIAHGAPSWALGIGGAAAVAAGLWMWHAASRRLTGTPMASRPT